MANTANMNINPENLLRMGASINKCLHNFKNPSVLFYYKGTTFPQVCDIPNLEQKMMDKAYEMIISGMLSGVSLEQQKIDYKTQLDLIEQTFCNISQGRCMDENTLKEVIEELEVKSVEALYSTWCLNICALLKMKVIKDDNNNGILTMKNKQ